jgi:hypothetical protein
MQPARVGEYTVADFQQAITLATTSGYSCSQYIYLAYHQYATQSREFRHLAHY